MKIHYKSFIKRIRELRKKLGIKQETLAEALNLSRPAVSQLETGFHQMPLPYIFIIADLFKIPVWQLFYSKNDLDNDAPLTNDEKDFVFKYRLLRDDKKALIHKLLEGLKG